MEKTSNIIEKLAKIQKELKAPKGQFNSFGKYAYRNCEDILEAVKPLLGDCALTLNDSIVQVGDRYYVKARATLLHGTDGIEAEAYAREALDKKGMDDAQITGAASSYARKYALNGLFCIDDTKDDDSDETPKTAKAPVASKTAPTARANPPVYKSDAIKEQEAKKRIAMLIDKLDPGAELMKDSSKEDRARWYGETVQKLTGMSLELASLKDLEMIGDTLGKIFDNQ